MRVDPHRARAGFTLVEIMIVVAIIGIFAAIAVPSWQRYQSNLQLRAAARSVSNAFSYARSHAISTGNRHIVVFATGAGTDACGNDILDETGRPVPVMVFDDGPAAAANCCLDDGEQRFSERAVPGVNWGVTLAAAPAPGDVGGGVYTTGSTLTKPDGTQAGWVAFGPDGIPVAFNAACNFGTTGTGAGAIYVTNGDRDYTVILNPLGTSNVERYDGAQSRWEN